jgi:hypothetical protein
VFGYTVSGMGSGQGWFSTSISGSARLTGGTYGLEASLVTVILGAAVATIVMIKVARAGDIIASSWSRQRLLAK